MLQGFTFIAFSKFAGMELLGISDIDLCLVPVLAFTFCTTVARDSGDRKASNLLVHPPALFMASFTSASMLALIHIVVLNVQEEARTR